MSPFQSVAVSAFLYYFLTPFSFVAVEFLRRYEKSENGTKSPWYERYEKSKDAWYEKSMVRIVHGTKSPQMVRNVYGTKSLWYEKSGSR